MQRQSRGPTEQIISKRISLEWTDGFGTEYTQIIAYILPKEHFRLAAITPNNDVILHTVSCTNGQVSATIPKKVFKLARHSSLGLNDVLSEGNTLPS